MLKKLFSLFKKRETKRCIGYDEIQERDQLGTFEGVRIDFLKKVAGVQTSHSLHASAENERLYYCGAYWARNNSALQFLVDINGNLQGRAVYSKDCFGVRGTLIGNLNNKNHIEQIDADYCSECLCTSSRLVVSDGSIVSTSSAVVSNRNATIGIECTTIKGRERVTYGVNMGARLLLFGYTLASSLYNGKVVQFLFMKQLNECVSLYTEAQVSRALDYLVSAGCTFKTEKGSVRTEIDNTYRTALVLDHKLASKISITASAEVFKGLKPKIGFGFCIED